MKKRFSSASLTNAASHVRLSTRGTRKNYRLHVDSGFQSRIAAADERSGYGSGWVIVEENSRYVWDGLGTSAHWGNHLDHSSLVELHGILNALTTISNSHAGIIHKTNHIAIYCDNDSVQEMMNKRIHDNEMSAFGNDVISKIMEFQNLVTLTFKWEKGHSTNTLNNIADKLSFFSRKDLEKFNQIGAFHMDLMLMDVLRDNNLHDPDLEKYILHYERRKDLCRDQKSVDLSFTVTLNASGEREAEWFALSGDDFEVGSFKLPKRRGGMEMITIAAAVLNAFNESGFHHDDSTILFSIPAKRSFLDDVFSVHRGDRQLKNNNSKVFKALMLMQRSMDSMNVRFIQENEDFRGMATTAFGTGSPFDFLP